MNDNNIEQNLGQGTQYQPNINTSEGKKSKKLILKILAIVGGFFVAIIILTFAIISIVSVSSNKLVCESSKGNITIMYNEEIVGYKSSKISYDFDKQKTYANRVGIDAYLKEFTEWFETTTSGTCVIKEK